MATLTRRKFLAQTSVGAATLGVLASALHSAAGHRLLGARGAATTKTTKVAPAALAEPMMVYVRDAAAGDVAFLVGTREIIRRDPVLVAHLLQGVL